MSLILAALCKDDICVCADTRYVDRKWNGGYKDGFDKIYKFDSCPLIIFNHGNNKFGEKYWSDYCLDYERLGRWKGRNLKWISEDFKGYVQNAVLQQLNFNMKQWPDDYNVRGSGFVVCGKNIQNNILEMYEFFWKPQPVLPGMYPWSGIHLNGFGTGYDIYLKSDLNSKPDKLVNWNAFNRGQIKSELERLFSVARESKKAREREDSTAGKEFSDDFIIKSVME
ncbi:MAG: hypothetical protein Q8P77_03675 [Candidatus Veblenbacteria bacterium]|nr:hypothetical protein [Candidatus Veblenbacteria bacterium]